MIPILIHEPGQTGRIRSLAAMIIKVAVLICLCCFVVKDFPQERFFLLFRKLNMIWLTITYLRPQTKKVFCKLGKLSNFVFVM